MGILLASVRIAILVEFLRPCFFLVQSNKMGWAYFKWYLGLSSASWWHIKKREIMLWKQVSEKMLYKISRTSRLNFDLYDSLKANNIASRNNSFAFFCSSFYVYDVWILSQSVWGTKCLRIINLRMFLLYVS